MDFANVLKLINGREVGGKTPMYLVTEEELWRKASAMQRRGYVHTEASLDALMAYLQGYGVLLSGGIGVGKTFFFKTVNAEPIAVLSFNQCNLWKFDKLDEWLAAHRGEEVVLDDIGWDASQGNNYGTRFEVLQVVLDNRLGCPARTHVTTNCTNEELIAKYDAHLIDRIYQLCKCFVMPPAESRREAQVNEVYLRNRAYARQMGKEVL